MPSPRHQIKKLPHSLANREPHSRPPRQFSWPEELAQWYRENGRHHLPWRHTIDPWGIVVSEIMLQQTSTSRVGEKWRLFLDLWPTPSACAAAPLSEIVHMWMGMGYPRRAVALHRIAQHVATHGWPNSEEGLLELPGVGRYTARALRVLAFNDSVALPSDVNVARVTARVVYGTEAEPTQVIDAALSPDRRTILPARDFLYALFDLGATTCRARTTRCAECPLQVHCASRPRIAADGIPERARKQRPYNGSFRQLRGTILRHALATKTVDPHDIIAHVGACGLPHGASEIHRAVETLQRDGLL